MRLALSGWLVAAALAASGDAFPASALPPAPWPTWNGQVVAVPPSTTGRTFYVDGRAGDDARDGLTPASAFRTIARAVPGLAAGDTVLIRKGLYREGIDLGKGLKGTAAKPVTFGSYGDGEVILDGSRKVEGWTRVSGSVWRAKAAFRPVAVVVEEVPLRQVSQGQSRSAPREGLAGVTSGSGKWHRGDDNVITADFSMLPADRPDPNVADIVVPGSKRDQAHVYFYGVSWVAFKGLTIRGSGSNGLWGYGSHVTVERCDIKFNAKSGVSFMNDGFPATDNAVIESHVYHNSLLNWPRGNNNYVDDGGGWPGGLAWERNLRPVARGNVVHMNGGEGIVSFGTDARGGPNGGALFERNVVYDNWSTNMYLDNQPDGVVRDNIVFNHAPDPSQWLAPPSAGKPWNRVYKYNACVSLADEQGSSDATNDHANLRGSRVYNNVLVGCRVGIADYAEGKAATRNHGLKDTLIANNTIVMPPGRLPNVETIGIMLHDNTRPSGVNRNRGSAIVNNVVVTFGEVPAVWLESAAAADGIAIDNNVYYNAAYATPFWIGFEPVRRYGFAQWREAMRRDARGTFADPLLEAPSAFHAPGAAPYDFASARPREGSPVRGAGLPLGAFTTDLRGSERRAWDAGAL